MAGPKAKRETFEINYRPHEGQLPFHSSPARFRVFVGGRRVGKTTAGANEAIKQSVERGPNSQGFIVGPTFWHTQQCWEAILNYLPERLVKDIYRSQGERRILLWPNRVMWFKSAEHPDALRSKGLDWVWLDEAGLISEEAWNFLRPSLMDKHGIAWFTGTPKGKNLFFKLYTTGQDELQDKYRSWQFPSSSNPYLDKNEIEDFRREMPKEVFNQEILATFIENVGSVFRDVTDHIRTEIKPYEKGEPVFIGCDVAKHADFTVLIALRGNGELVGFDRFGEVDWVFQQQRILSFYKRYINARFLIDSTGIGDPILDQLRREIPNAEGYQFTATSKRPLVENLSIMLDQDKIGYLNNQILINEMQLYSYDLGTTGNVHYGAPEGYHDDCVMALALAAWLISHDYVMPKIVPFIEFGRVSTKPAVRAGLKLAWNDDGKLIITK
jgi:hypothetical protein